MLENETKREILPIGSFKDKPHSSFSGQRLVWSSSKKKYVIPGWVEKGEHVISLGIPIGNDLNVSAFLSGKYREAKAKLASVNLVSSIGLIGKHQLLNANYYGKFRYYLWSLPSKIVSLES